MLPRLTHASAMRGVSLVEFVVLAPILYLALGIDGATRQAAYRELFRYQLDVGLVDEIRKATNGNYALGNALFVQQIEDALGRRVTAGKAGRPKLIDKNNHI